MATNVRDPLLLNCYEAVTVETVTKALPAAASNFGLAYTRTGALPVLGAYAAGLCTKSTPATERALPLVTTGYGIGRLAAGAVVPLDSPLAVNAAGELIVATGVQYVIGRAIDSSTGGGTAQVPHWVGVKLA
jgi:hypothetical protein